MSESDMPQKQLTKAYENQDFLNSSDARAIRLLAEYLEPMNRMNEKNIKDTVVFYGSARIKPQDEADAELQEALKSNDGQQIVRANRTVRMARYYEDARKLAFKLAMWSKTLKDDKRFIVCSGGGPGIMEAANRGASEAGADNIGMNISLPFEQYPNPYITEELSFEFHYFFMRKFWFVYPARALVVFPGGFGTMDELFELLTLRQTLKVTKPLRVLVYGKEFWDSVVDFDKLVDWGVISADDLNLFHMVDDVDEAFDMLKDHFEKEFLETNRYWHW